MLRGGTRKSALHNDEKTHSSVGILDARPLTTWRHWNLQEKLTLLYDVELSRDSYNLIQHQEAGGRKCFNSPQLLDYETCKVKTFSFLELQEAQTKRCWIIFSLPSSFLTMKLTKLIYPLNHFGVVHSLSMLISALQIIQLIWFLNLLL